MSFENRYSALDRTLHRLAFASPSIQVAVADLEERIFAKELGAVELHRPVFVTGLPRAGTTLLLEIIESLSEFAAHSYRNMPFVLCPLLWDRFSARFQRSDEAQERAHQDGMLVTIDSPEAFEEMVWKAFWPRHYTDDRIRPWTRGDPDFLEFLRNHMRKIIALSRRRTQAAKRYLSKNNLNIARLPLLRTQFADSLIIVPFREPLQHAASLLRQHVQFLDMHHQDRFARDYMAGIGHYDFGENLRPVDFDGWLDHAQSRDATTLSFWLEYWYRTYNHIAGQQDILLVCYDDLCASPSDSLARIGAAIAPDDAGSLLEAADRFRSPRSHPVDNDAVDNALLERAQNLYDRLRDRPD